MAYKFGAATNNLISYTANGTALFATNRTSLITIWVYPTTLAATRIMWGASTLCRLAIDSTVTSSCKVTLDCVTTDAVFTFPAGLAINTWTFIAVFTNQGTGPTLDVNAWTATADGPLVKQTVTAVTAGVGAFVSSALLFSVGNTSAPTLSWQGDIANVAAFADDSGTVPGLLGVIADGATSAAELDQLVPRLIVPLWRGDVSRIAWAGSRGIANATATPYNGLQVLAPLEDHLWTIKPTSAGFIEATLSGATVSPRRSPRPFRMVNDTPLFNHGTRTPQAVG